MKYTKRFGPAFDHCRDHSQDVTLRDYFAAKAFERLVDAHIQGSIDDLSKDIISSEAYDYADYMMAERSK